MNFNDFEIEKEYIKKIHNNNVYNKTIINYYTRLFNEKKELSKANNVCERIDSCNKFWLIDRYDYNLIKDFKRTYLCKDKFCNNCKKLKQASRMSRYIPELEQYSDNLYHLTLTVPNVSGIELKETIKKMSLAFRTLIICFRRKNYLSFIDFKKHGYLGCIRSLEITFKDDLYHPHYHCAFVFKNLNLEKKYKNSYSVDYINGRQDKLFSEFEIIIQKLWKMIYNNMALNKTNFDNLELGYSCNCNKFNENDYAELFKYMTKETNEDNNILTYENFKVLYESTRFVKQIQGYGCLFRINDKDLDEEIDKIYCDIKNMLEKEEQPVEELSRPKDLLNDIDYKLISRKRVYQYLRELGNTEQ